MKHTHVVICNNKNKKGHSLVIHSGENPYHAGVVPISQSGPGDTAVLLLVLLLLLLLLLTHHADFILLYA